MRAKQEQEMEQVKKKAAEEVQKSKREESQEDPFSVDSEVSEDTSLKAQQDTEEENCAGSNKCILILLNLFFLTCHLKMCLLTQTIVLRLKMNCNLTPMILITQFTKEFQIKREKRLLENVKYID